MSCFIFIYPGLRMRGCTYMIVYTGLLIKTDCPVRLVFQFWAFENGRTTQLGHGPDGFSTTPYSLFISKFFHLMKHLRSPPLNRQYEEVF